MADASINNSQIAKNTIYLYLRMILLMLVSLYTSRVVLITLGIEDYGIYNVVAGFIGMLSFLNGAMSGSTQRFITVELGKNNNESLEKVFSTCIITHAMVALLVFFIAESIGLWFVLEKLVIPEERMFAAIIVYQCSIVTAVVQIMSYPYIADIVAHEKMSAFAYISVYEAFANLALVFLIQIGNWDHLILYAIALLVVKISVITVYCIYCKRNFVEASVKTVFDKYLVKKMITFTGWNLWGGIASTLMGQGVNILLNIFFGPTVNSARALAVQVQSAVTMFASNFQMAMNPQIMKTYASDKINLMHSLIFRSAKFTFILLLCIILPLMMEVNTVLSLWLKVVPKYTNIFVCLTLVICMLDSVSNPFMTASAATGRVKVYQSVVGSILLLIVPMAYIVLYFGAAPYMVFIVHLLIGIIAFIVRLIIVKQLINLSIRLYFTKVIIPCSLVLVPSLVFAFLFKSIMPEGVLYSCLNAIFLIITVITFSFLIGLNKDERVFVLSKIFHINM